MLLFYVCGVCIYQTSVATPVQKPDLHLMVESKVKTWKACFLCFWVHVATTFHSGTGIVKEKKAARSY